jgi:hypothetical protein
MAEHRIVAVDPLTVALPLVALKLLKDVDPEGPPTPPQAK